MGSDPNAFSGDLWSVSRSNYAAAVREPMRLPAKVTLCDVTVREGTAQAAVKFTDDEQCELLQMLDEFGVPMFELHFNESFDAIYSYTKRIKDLGLKAKLIAFVSPAYEWKMPRRSGDWKKIVDAQTAGGADIVYLSYFLSEWRLKGSVYEQKMEPSAIIEWMNTCIDYVKARGAVPMIGVTDTTRCDLELVKQAYKSHVEAGAEFLVVNDSFGGAIPSAMKHVVAEVKAATGGALVKVHCHNDLGLAVANTLGAVEGGADIVDGTLNGYGDRGFADLTAIVINLTVNYGYDLGLDLGRLYEISKVAERMTGMPIAPDRPLVGDYAFSTSIELHHHAMGDLYWSASVLDPRLYGKTAKLFLTATSGPVVVRRKLDELGLEVNDEQLTRLVELIAQADETTKGILSDDKIRTLVASI